MLPFCEIEEDAFDGPKQYLKYGNENNLCVDFRAEAPESCGNVC